MGWPQVEPTTAHLLYLSLSLFLITFALFSELIRNRLHMSEPPLATLAGILMGPRTGVAVLDPKTWEWRDDVTQELTRVIVGVQVFVVGIELPRRWLSRHWRSVLMLLVPVMSFGWLISAAVIHLVLLPQLSFKTALIISACLTPTDPVLSASVLGEAKFSQRIPKRLRHLLAAESACNDGIAFPFLYAGLLAVTSATSGQAVKSWFLDVILWQCLIGAGIGLAIGKTANFLLKLSEKKGFIMDFTLFVFYFLMAIFCIGVGSTLGADDFLVCFGAGTAFAWDGWFAEKTEKIQLPNILDLLLNSTLFVYFGAILPWSKFPSDMLGVGSLFGCLVLILLLRRIPIMLAVYRWIPDICNFREALFAGHFGPVGVGALFLAIEARARLETGTSTPLHRPPPPNHSVPNQDAIDVIWPVVCFVVLGSVMVHGLSAMVMSMVGHFSRPVGERSHLIGGESERLYGMENGLDVPGMASDDSDG
jgi:sodium/hydrogen antiporter